MTDKCEFCKGTGKEPGESGCGWCWDTGLKKYQNTAEPPVGAGPTRYTIARLRYAGGEEHNVKYVSEVDYDRVVAKLATAEQQVVSLMARLHDALLAERDERAAFEAWVITRKVCTHKGATLKKDRAGNYMDYRINDRWLTWQARAALELKQ